MMNPLSSFQNSYMYQMPGYYQGNANAFGNMGGYPQFGGSFLPQQSQMIPSFYSLPQQYCPPMYNPCLPQYVSCPPGGNNLSSLINNLSQMLTMLTSLIGNQNCTPCQPLPPICPPPEENKIMGSAGLFGDPKFGLFSPGIANIPESLKAFESGIKAGQNVTILQDPDNGGLSIKGTGVQVDPANANSVGIGEIQLQAGTDAVTIKNNGDILVNNQVKGNINATGLVAPITLANGAVISTALEIDGTNGATAERFVIKNAEYKITAALRKPHADSAGYFDMNFEELKMDAADNAAGYQASIPGLADKYGIADLLRLEPGDLQIIS